MRRIINFGLLVVALPVAALSACNPEEGRDGGSDGPTSSGDPTVLPDGSAATLLPARIRRLTNFEYADSIKQLLPYATAVDFTDRIAVDARQKDFTRNEDQRVDPVIAGQYQELAEEIAAEAVGDHLTELVPCAAQEETRECASEFIDVFAPRAYRRLITDEDRTALLTVYDAGIEGGAFKDGIELVLQAIFQSASFLYHTEIGDGTGDDGLVRLTNYEIAAEMAYLLAGQPPDDELIRAAGAGELTDPEKRSEQAYRILADGNGRGLYQMRRLVMEWLGIDGVTNLAKNAEKFPDWSEQRFAFLEETNSFINDVMQNGAKVSELLAADYTYIPNNADYAALLGEFYGVPTPPAGRFTVPDGTRKGILTQPSFLARRAHENDSAPVLRGVAVLRRVMCVPVGDPGALNLMVVPPAPDPALTTRERFAIHAEDPACSSCHDAIDGVGFTYESFDAIGQYRTMENDRPIDTSGSVGGGTDMDGDYASSVELAGALATSDRVKECFAKNFYRFASAQHDEDAEDTFVQAVWDGLDVSGKDNVADILIRYVKSDLFVVRRPE
jgi:hypothetical protein